MAVKPYDKTTHDGKVVDVLTDQALCEAEKRLGFSLTILQGSYNKGGVSASAGTHDGGGVVDLAPYDWEKKVHVMRAVGFAAWHRTAIPGVWGEHIHCVLIGNQRLSAAAQGQVIDYRNHRDGLAGNGPDDTWHPDPIPVFRFQKPKAPTRGKRVDQAIALLQSTKRKGGVRKASIAQALKNLLRIKPW